MKTKILLCACFAALNIFQGMAQHITEVMMDSTLKDHKIIFFGKGEESTADSTANTIRMFYMDQFRHFQDPLAPYFLFMSKDADLAMGVGGVVRNHILHFMGRTFCFCDSFSLIL